VAERRSGGERADVLLDHHGVVNAGERHASVAGGVEGDIIVADQRVGAVEAAGGSVAKNSVRSAAGAEREIIALDDGVADAGGVDDLRIRARGAEPTMWT